MGFRFANNTNTAKVPDYWRVDAMVSYTINDIRLAVNGYNLTDEDIYAGAVRPELPDAHHTWALAAEGLRRKECFTERRPHSPGCRYPAARRSNPTCRAPGTMG